MKWGNGDQYEWTLGGEVVNKNLLQVWVHLGKNGVMFMLLQHEHVSKWGSNPMHDSQSMYQNGEKDLDYEAQFSIIC